MDVPLSAGFPARRYPIIVAMDEAVSNELLTPSAITAIDDIRKPIKILLTAINKSNPIPTQPVNSPISLLILGSFIIPSF